MTYDDLYCLVGEGASLMANGRHSFVAFYPSDWLAGTARLPRLHRSIYFDVCCYIWDIAKPVPPRELKLMIADVKNGQAIIDDLVEMGKLDRLPDGSISNAKALTEAEKAYDLHKRKSEGGKAAQSAGRSAGRSAQGSLPIEPEPELEEVAPNGACASADALKPEHVVEVWNETAARLGKPKVRDLTPARRQLLKARIAQHDLEAFQQVFANIEGSPFLRGDKGWQGCSFDWVFKAANFQKILEGNYVQ
jgi:hypothetical protein